MGSQNNMYQRQTGPGYCCNMQEHPEARMVERHNAYGKCKPHAGKSYTDCDSMPIAMAYVPWQGMEELYSPCKSLCEGTAFPRLNLIFCGVRG